MCRGNERREIFRNDHDRMAFLRFLAQSREIYTVNIHAYVLMADHFHLLVETPLGNLSEFMRRFNITYTGYFNRRHKRVGHLYQGRYKSLLVEKNAYLSMVSRYIHLNPVRIKSLEDVSVPKKIEQLRAYPWSSLPGYLETDKRQSMITYALVLAEFGGETHQGRDSYRKQIHSDIAEDLDVQSLVFGQSILGSENFIDKITKEHPGTGQEREQPAVRHINQYRNQGVILAEIEKETGRNLDDLKREKGDLRRVAMDLLYRHGGLKGPAIGELFGLDYSAVSQERKRLRVKLGADSEICRLVDNLEERLSTLKI
ncbi:REP element-mobilizing transposase RayT [Geoalkalibacter ferrihydriticus]|uniref:REP element-mobilizing transposase RayT n=2 Tax=Geoalkalibacter ferrihydriticus TaxID=392333 RepID=A0A1G9K7A0_9BACT|nr:transposase [Geoalkalibacter ferrihydriticus]SDL45133.1 REP element-mobilizing transposase RayT [Geoalkalibacter ferrihydriticus]